MAADFVARLQDAEAKETEDVELVCQLSKIGVPVRWMKNRKPLEPSERIKIVCDRYRHMLRIMETIPEDEAEYTIVLPDNKESSCNLTIYCKGNNRHLTSYRPQRWTEANACQMIFHRASDLCKYLGSSCPLPSEKL